VLDLAILQSYWHFHSTKGSSIFADEGADTALRTLFNLHTEDITIVASQRSGIEQFSDLKGKRVNIGSPESGQRRTMDLILKFLGWSHSDFQVVNELSASEMAEALCSDRIDAFVYIVGHPNTSINEATSFCDSRLVSLPESLIDSLSKQYPFYKPGEIAGGLYRGNPEPTKTLQLTATLVAHSSLPDTTAYELTKAVYENFDLFKEMHPALHQIDAVHAFFSERTISPRHAGAESYLDRVRKK